MDPGDDRRWRPIRGSLQAASRHGRPPSAVAEGARNRRRGRWHRQPGPARQDERIRTMSRYLQRPRRRITVYVGILMVAGLAWTARAQQQPPVPPANQASNFTGGEVTTLKAEGRLS